MIIEKSMKKIIASLMICALAIAGFGVAPQNIKASTSAVTFDGATIREANGETKQAMRFKLTVPDATGVDSCGFVLAKEANIPNYESLTVDSPNVIVVSTENSAYRNLYSKDGNKVEYTACITGIPNTDYSTNIVAKAFIKSGETITYATSTETEAKKNIKAVAEGAGRYLSNDGTLSKADFISGEALGTSASYKSQIIGEGHYSPFLEYTFTSEELSGIIGEDAATLAVTFDVSGYKTTNEGGLQVGLDDGTNTHWFYSAGELTTSRTVYLNLDASELGNDKYNKAIEKENIKKLIVRETNKAYVSDSIKLISAEILNSNGSRIGKYVINYEAPIPPINAWQAAVLVDLSSYDLTQYREVKVEATVTNADATKLQAALATVNDKFNKKNYPDMAAKENKGLGILDAKGFATISVPAEIASSGVGLIIRPTVPFAGDIIINKVVLVK